MELAKRIERERERERERCKLSFLGTFVFVASVFFIAPLAAQAALYLPGATLDPACAPTDPNCGISTVVASSTANSIPYYSANGSALSATSTFQILSNGTASTTNLIVVNSLTLGTLSGFLKATAGAIATSLINLASDVTGILPVSNGGTGVAAIASGFIPFGNNTNAIATSSSLYWDSANSRLGIGTTSPYRQLSVGNSGVFGGDVTAATFTATSTTATSTFAGPISTPNPVDVYDNFSGPAGGSIFGRMPTQGAYAWTASGVGYLGSYVGNGILGTTGGNTYFIAQSSRTPWEVTATFTNTAGAPAATISIVKDYPGHNFGAMWHTNFGTGITPSYWNSTWNGSGSDVVGVGPTYGAGTACPALTQNVYYVARIVLNPPYADASIETTNGTVLCTNRSYEPLLSNLIGPYVYIQSGDSSVNYSSFSINDKPTSPNLLYGRSVSGLEGTPIGATAPAAGNFSMLTVGSSTPRGVFTATYDGTASAAPGFWSTATANLIVGSTVSGNIAKLTLQNGAGGTGVITMDGGYVFSLAGNSGTAFLTKPANAGVPYFASALGIGTSVAKSTLDVNGSMGIGTYAGVIAAPSNGLIVSGNVGIGTTTPFALLSVSNSVSTPAGTTLFAIASTTGGTSTTTVFSVANTGDVTIKGSSGSTCTIGNGVTGTSCSSDERLKTNIALIVDPLKSIEQIRGVTFNWVDQNKSQAQFIGVIAQDVQKVFPQAVSTVGGYFAVDYGALVAPLIEAVKELSGQVKSLAATVAGFTDSFTSKNITATENITATQHLCVGSVCVDASQLKKLLDMSGQSPIIITDVSTTSTATSTDSTFSTSSEQAATTTDASIITDTSTTATTTDAIIDTSTGTASSTPSS